MDKATLVRGEEALAENIVSESAEENPIIIPPSSGEEDLIPDWLKPNSSVGSESPETYPDEDALDTTAPILPLPSPDAELPDWLRNSIDTTESPD